MVGAASHENQEGTSRDWDPESRGPVINMNGEETISDRSGHKGIGIDQHDFAGC